MFSTELGLLDAVARVTSDILKTSFLRDRPTTLSSLYFIVVWTLIAFGIGVLLIGFGAYKLVRSRHPRYGGMQMSQLNLVVWSFLMASAHGAGLMVAPLLLGPSAMDMPASAGAAVGLMAALVHTAGYLLVTGVVAVIVYEYFGVLFLRRAWINLDLIWAVALVLTGVATLLI